MSGVSLSAAFKRVVHSALLSSSFLFAAAVPAAEVIPYHEFDLVDYRGKVVYLDFWATWCGVCRTSMPWLEQMQARYGGDSFEVVTVNVDEQEKAFRSFMQERRPAFKVVRDSDGVLAQEYGVVGTPTSFVIDHEGEVAFSHVGFQANLKVALESSFLQMIGRLSQSTVTASYGSTYNSRPTATYGSTYNSQPGYSVRYD